MAKDKKSSRYSFKIIFIICLLLTLGITISYFNHKIGTTTKENSNNTTNNWKIYENTNAGVSLKYPPSWEDPVLVGYSPAVMPEKADDATLNVRIEFSDEEKFATETFYLYPFDFSGTLEELAARQISREESSMHDSCTQSINLIQKRIEINNNTGILLSNEDESCYRALFIHKNHAIELDRGSGLPLDKFILILESVEFH